MRRLLQPIAFSVPNSRVRRVTPEMVKRIAMRKAAASTMMDSQVPRLATSWPAVHRDPETLEARSACVLTVAVGSAFLRSVLIWSMSLAEAAFT